MVGVRSFDFHSTLTFIIHSPILFAKRDSGRLATGPSITAITEALAVDRNFIDK